MSTDDQDGAADLNAPPQGDAPDADDSRAARRSRPRRRRHSRSPSSDPPSAKRTRTATDPTNAPPQNLNPEGWTDGAIVRITVENFVTYDAMTCRPGPRLNMVVGPNGTGKSSIVSAMALGLGGAPGLLGRQTDVSEFIKHGRDEATIEMELFRSGHANLVVTRKLVAGSNSSRWLLNGRQATRAHVLNALRPLNVQVDNLCQFLPQDKVASFAELTPEQLLEATMRAAEPDTLPAQHQQLVTMRKAERELRAQLETDREALAREEARNQRLEADIARIRERRALESEIAVADALLQWVEYQRRRDELRASKEAADAAEAERNRALESVRPLETRVGECESAHRAGLEAVRSAAQRRTTAESALDGGRRAITSADSALNTAEEQLAALDAQLSGRRAKLRQSEQRLAQQTEAVEQQRIELVGLGALPPTAEDAGRVAAPDATMRATLPWIKARRAEVDAEHRRAEERLQRARDRIQEHVQKRMPLDGKRAEAQMLLDKARSLRDKRLQALEALPRGDGRAVLQAYSLLNNGQLQLQRRAFLVAAAVETTDPRHNDVVETMLSLNHLLSIIVQTNDDYHTLKRELVERLRLRVNIVKPRELTTSAFRPSLARDDLCRATGLDGYLIDMVHAEEPVKAFLCQHANFHEIPVGLGPSATVDGFLEFNQASGAGGRVRFGDAVVAGTHMRVRTAYGAQSMSSRPVLKSRILQQSINAEELAEADAQARDAAEKIAEHDATAHELQRDAADVQAQVQQLHEQVETLRRQRNSIQQRLTSYETHRITLTRQGSSLKEQRDALVAEAVAGERATLQKQVTRAAEALARKAAAVPPLQQQVISALSRRTKECLQLVRSTFALEKARGALAHAREQLASVEESAQRAKDAHDALRDEIRAESRRIKENMRALSSEDRDAVQDGGAAAVENAEQLRTDLEAARARLALLTVDHANVLDEFEARRRTIDDLQVRVDAQTADAERTASELAAVSAPWLAALSLIISRLNASFSASFERLGCAGEVRLHEDPDDYARYGIQIMCKFRDAEMLQQLSARRQSGGERAVATIMYLMALQGLTQVPFRVVDEINQGMDPRNERTVHNLLVHIASRPQSSQYFLITPKLLPDLEYHPGMSVLCVYNGRFVSPGLCLESALSAARGANGL